MNLIDIHKEVFVGACRCDLVAKDETTGIKVIIENQLEPTNHDHLGKLITYASGLDATVVIWITKEAKQEHRSAIEWLNNRTSKEISFFLIEIHAYKIGDSLPAPKFEVIEQPNDFNKNSKMTNLDGQSNRIQAERLHFWSEFNNQVQQLGKPFNIRKPSTDHWYSVALGTSGACISITLVNKNKNVGVEVYIHDNKELFDNLFSYRDSIEENLGFSMAWHRLEHKKASRIIYYIDGLDFNNQSNYPKLMQEIIQKVIRIRDVFKEFIK